MSQAQSNGRILANAMEAIVGAAYLSAPFESVQRFVIALLAPVLEKHKLEVSAGAIKDFKTRLQELTSKKWRIFPRYRLEETEGEANNLSFVVSLEVGTERFVGSSTKTKKDAEQRAAEAAFRYFSHSEPS